MSEICVITGGLGFIGSAFVRRALQRGLYVRNLDAHTYAADLRRVPDGHDRLTYQRVDVGCDDLDPLFLGARVAVHFAAETHVSRGETAPGAFFRSNVDGTRRVLEAADRGGVEFVVHISTDEVYGPARTDRAFYEDDKAPGEGRATSTYARSKALADDIAQSFGGTPKVIVVRPTNCFGPWQHPEKAVARWVTRALTGRRLPVWGDGAHVRDWMFVDDVCTAIETLIESDAPPGAYNIGPQGGPVPNLAIAHAIARLAGREDDAVYLTAYDRPHHDRAYSIDCSRMRSLGWVAATGVREGLRATLDWYRTNRDWWEPHVARAEALYDDGRDRVSS